MKNRLQQLLLDYIRENNPDLLQQLLADDALQAWVYDKIKEVELVLIQSKPFKAIEVESMERLTADLRPNRIRYIRDLLEERFPEEYEQLLSMGLLTYELITMVSICQDLFEIYPITEDMEQPELDRRLVIKISEYLLNQYQTV